MSLFSIKRVCKKCGTDIVGNGLYVIAVERDGVVTGHSVYCVACWNSVNLIVIEPRGEQADVITIDTTLLSYNYGAEGGKWH